MTLPSVTPFSFLLCYLMLCVSCIIDPADAPYVSPSEGTDAAQSVDMRLVPDMSVSADLATTKQDMRVVQGTDMRQPPGRDMSQAKDMARAKDMFTPPRPDMAQSQRCVEGEGCDCSEMPCEARPDTVVDCKNRACDVICVGACKLEKLGAGSTIVCTGAAGKCEPECDKGCEVKCQVKGNASCEPKCKKGVSCTLLCENGGNSVCKFGECGKNNEKKMEEPMSCESGNRLVCGGSC